MVHYYVIPVCDQQTAYHDLCPSFIKVQLQYDRESMSKENVLKVEAGKAGKLKLEILVPIINKTLFDSIYFLIQKTQVCN